jgi:hypothetical protein
MEGVWYMDAPVSNIIRSNGDQGKIRVTVSAGGVASGYVEIEGVAENHDNSVIIEPALKNEGRSQVNRLVLEPKRLEEVPREIKLSYNEIKLTAKDPSGYRKAIREYIVKYNPAIDTTSTEFRVLTSLFCTYLMNNNGVLIADDYNFNADHFNTCRLISGYIKATKLPQQFKDGLREYYSSSINIDGNEKNAGEEMNWLNWIPSGGTVVYYNENTKSAVPKGTLSSEKDELPDLIALVHPQFASFTPEGRERALEFIKKMNPYVHVNEISEVVDGKKVTKTSLKAEKGKPVLIPLYKFIAE